MPKSKTYFEFVEKFKPKKTTDDCYTPPAVYQAVLDWCIHKYGINEKDIVRPFYPGGDYENFEYEGKVVVDNPLFSFLTRIVDFYIENKIKFFLFAPSLTAISSCKDKVTMVITDENIVYQNGANVKTGFITNMEGDAIVITAPELKTELRNALNRKGKPIPKYHYPNNLLTTHRVQKISNFPLVIKKGECKFIRKLESQKKTGKAIFGGGLLISQQAAERISELEKQKGVVNSPEGRLVFTLTENEKEIVKNLSVNN